MNAQADRVLLVAEDADLAPVIEFAEATHARRDQGVHVLVLLGSTGEFPFRARPSRIIVPAMPEGVIASMPRLEEQGIASRLASARGDPGCYEGSVIDLARGWVEALDGTARAALRVVAFGGSSMQCAVAALAASGAIPGPSLR